MRALMPGRTDWLSRSFLAMALILTSGALISYLWVREPSAFLSIEKTTCDLGRLPLGQRRLAEFRVTNTSEVPLTIAGIDNEPC